MEVSKPRTEKRIPPSLKGTIYQAMAVAIGEELYEYRESIRKIKQSLWDVYAMDRDRLIQISKTFDVPFIASLDDTDDFARQEVMSIPFKIKYKGTATLYKSLFLAANRTGQLFIYYYQSSIDSLIRDSKDPIADLPIIAPGETFAHASSNNFSGFVEERNYLDTGLRLDVGGIPLWTLDERNTQMTTNHLGLEYVIDRIIKKTVNGKEKEYLMTTEYLDFLSINMEYGRRAKEVPHIGSQLNIQTDLSGTFDSFEPGSKYTMPSIKVKAATRSDTLSLIESVDDFTHVEFGTGCQRLPSSDPADTTPFPTSLAKRVGISDIIYKERYENARSIGVIGEYIGQEINQFILYEAKGGEREFDAILPYKPIRRGNVRLIITQPQVAPKIITDDQIGNLIGDFGQGTIDYNTGEISIKTKFNKVITETPAVPPEYDSSTEPEKRNYTIQLKNGDINPGSVALSFHVGDGNGERINFANDNGAGAFSENPHILHSVINYHTGQINIEFAEPLTPNSPFRITFSYPVDFPLPKGAKILADYYFTQTAIEITEAGLFNSDGVLISYATFPPLEFSAVDHHVNILFAFRKDVLFNGDGAKQYVFLITHEGDILTTEDGDTLII